MKFFTALGALLLALTLAPRTAVAGKHRLGLGAHYWKTIDQVDFDEIDEDGIAWLGTYQYWLNDWVSIEGDLEFLPDGFGGATDTVTSPQAYFLVGSGLYAGLGIGTYYTDGDFTGDTFYALRAGINLNVLPSIYVDINANYRFEQWDEINNLDEKIDQDTVTLGAAVRVEL